MHIGFKIMKLMSEEGNGGGGAGTVSFDDMLKNPDYQAEFDRRISKALNTQREKLEADTQTRINDAVSEANKLARMNAQQKEDHERQKREEELAKREAELSRRELVAQAKATLSEKGLDSSLADLLNYENAEKCSASIDLVEKIVGAAVGRGVESRLSGSDPIKKAPEKKETEFDEEAIFNAMKRGF